MKRILFISPVLPDNNGSGREKRAYYWLQKLQHHYEVDWLVITTQNLHTPTVPLSNYQHHQLSIPYARISKVAHMAAICLSFTLGSIRGSSLLGWYPLQKHDRKQLYNLYSNLRYEKIICFRLYLSEFAQYLQTVTHTTSMWLDMDDIESATWNSIGNLLLKNRIYKAGIYHKLAAAQFYVNEHKMLRLFDRIFVCSRKDQELLSSRFLTLDIHIHANKIESKPIPSISPTHGLTMLFVGTLGYYPNEEAIRWFVNHVFRIMHQRDNRFALIVAGYAPSVSLHSFLQQTPGITVYANCNDLASVYQLAQLAVTPLHAGGGTKIKVLEAMQYGLPVIATQEAVNGLDLEPGKHYIAAETSNEFIKSCEAILYNSNSYEKMRKDAYAIVNNQYSYTY